MILILAPMRMELRPAVRRFGARRGVIDDIDIFRARRGSTEVVATRLGIGPVVARERTAVVLDRLAARGGDVSRVLVSGIAGGIDGVSPIGTLVVPERIIDLASGADYASSDMPGVLPRGTMATSGRDLITDPDRLAELRRQGVLALDMETAAVAAECKARGIPWTAFRVISDRPDDGLVDPQVASLLHDDGRADIRGGVRLFLREPGRIPGLIRLARDSGNAARRAADAAARAADALLESDPST
ncbi:MAG TPA: hypothetical protein VGR90_09380 [Acidimicrobiales bacterium]|nr:hypothetical protein [Acidimicrobiales bacterium]